MIQSVQINQRVITARITQGERVANVFFRSPNRVKAILIGTQGPAGRDGTSTSTFIVGETPTGVMNGSNTSFTLAHTPATNSLAMYLNGLRMRQGGVI